MVRGCMGLAVGRWGLVLLALVSALPVRAAFAGEQLFVAVPSDWNEAWRHESPQQTIVEYLPPGATVADWTDMVTTQEFPNTHVDLLQYLDKVATAFGTGCKAARHEGPRASTENGYDVALAYLECRDPDPAKAAPGVVLKSIEFLAIKAIQGVKGLHVVQRAWHGDDPAQHPLQSANAKDWVAVVRDAELCDLADTNRTCRTVGRTGGLTQ